MALNLNCSNKNNINSTKVAGDLGDIQITENSDCEDDHINKIQKVSRNNKSTIPANLLQNTVPVFGKVTVSNSDNVQFGNNTYFNGPVTIKQVIHTKSGVDNAAYSSTEDEIDPNSTNLHNGKFADTLIKKEQILLWHKITFCAVCFTVIGSIVAIVLVLQNKSEQQRRTNPQTDFKTPESHNDPLLIAPDHLRIVSRTDWLAQPVEKPLKKLVQPVPWVIITHTATETCLTQSQCVLRVRLIQSFHIESRGWDDIGYNFLVGGDGSIYYGRGWDYEGAHTKGYNKYSIGIAFIGTFNNDPPSRQQLEACQKIIKRGVQLRKLAEDYKLFAHRQLMSTLSPGDELFNIIKKWPNFVSNVTDLESLIPN
ncbi:peptidoglycan-recognition protein LE-like isoform X2 [Vanessa cardui]|uniref:peptidoglycan-recognition protein LE-like isoform X2 n=1 Tax=Vanessa cardui TaxID=171605 RepID=UPI001F13257A|nr:peptidoglycan-recognition protein LE-like isoform X2 [Vanessa cardui]